MTDCGRNEDIEEAISRYCRTLAYRIASFLDKPSVYMGGPSPKSMRLAREIAERQIRPLITELTRREVEVEGLKRVIRAMNAAREEAAP